MHSKKFFISLAIVMLLLPLQASAGDSLFNTRKVDLGNIKGKKQITVIFKYNNLTGKTLHMEHVWTSCSCINITFPKEPIRPKQKGKVYITFRLGSAKRAFSKTAIIYYNDCRPTILKINGKII